MRPDNVCFVMFWLLMLRADFVSDKSVLLLL